MMRFPEKDRIENDDGYGKGIDGEKYKESFHEAVPETRSIKKVENSKETFPPIHLWEREHWKLKRNRTRVAG